VSIRPAVRNRRAASVAIAGAFLAPGTRWEAPAMARRGMRAMGTRRVWLVAVAEAIVARYPEPPRDRPRELARAIAAVEAFRRATQAGAENPSGVARPRRWVGAPTAMAPAPWPVPPLPDVAALAAWLGVDDAHLAWFADVRSRERTATDERLRHHTRRWLAKADGSARLLEAPKRELKDMQRQVLHHVLDRVPPHDAAHGFRPGRSAHTAAAPHVGRDVVVRLDVEAFFTHVTAGRVYGVLRLAGYPEGVAHALTGLCTTVTPRSVLRAAPPARPGAPGEAVERRRRLLRALAAPHLAQGAPTSPALANLVAHNLDRRLAGLAAAVGATYTRYADDLAFSGGPELRRAVGGLVRRAGAIVRDEGFRLHDGKTRVRTAAQRQLVTGVVVNARPNVARDDYDRLRAVLHDAARSGPAAANRAGHPDFHAHLLGRIAWVAATNPARGERLHEAFAAITW
jgi:hypothetical protein